jgi:hypothetical protein
MKKNHMRIEKREREISDEETVEKIINYAHWLKYREPQDENERWYNRWIDRVIDTIENYIDTF